MLSFIVFDIESGRYLARNGSYFYLTDKLEQVNCIFNGYRNEHFDGYVTVWVAKYSDSKDDINDFSRYRMQDSIIVGGEITPFNTTQAIAKFVAREISKHLDKNKLYLVPFHTPTKELDFTNMFSLLDWVDPDKI